MYGKTRDAVECFSAFLDSRLLYLFSDKEFNNFPNAFANQTLFAKGVKVASAVYESLIKHA